MSNWRGMTTILGVNFRSEGGGGPETLEKQGRKFTDKNFDGKIRREIRQQFSYNSPDQIKQPTPNPLGSSYLKSMVICDSRFESQAAVAVKHSCTHVCGEPLSRYTCRSRLPQVAVSRYTSPLKKPCRTCRPSTVRGVARQAASEKVSLYIGV